MYALSIRDRARDPAADGMSGLAIARKLGVGQTTVSRWLRLTLRSDQPTHGDCRRDGLPEWTVSDRSDYGYLLGQYLGDGYIVRLPRTFVLSICTCTDYPKIQREVEEAVERFRGHPPGRRSRPKMTVRMISVQSRWAHWPCLLPQHGRGMKHQRRILLEDWQQEIVDADPWPLLRGLIIRTAAESRIGS
jgi:hypothetical protein